MRARNHYRRAVVIAPYSPVGSGDVVHLGAARKISLVVEALSVMAKPVILVNSAHNSKSLSGTAINRRTIGDVRVIEITPPTLPCRPLGKVFNLFWALRFSVRKWRNGLQIVWIYNGYIFEALSIRLMADKGATKVLEVEDWPGARRGKLAIKNLLDQLGLRVAVKWADVVFAINEHVANRLVEFGARVVIPLPGLVSSTSKREIEAKRIASARVAGYCGGLSKEKGCGLLLELASRLPSGWQLKVAGVGPMTSDFERASNTNERLKFVGALNEAELAEFICSCDVLLNPHSDISAMGAGIFPFKVIDYLASGAVVMSTPLPKVHHDIEAAVIICDATAQSFLDALTKLDLGSEDLELRIQNALKAIEENYSVSGLVRRLQVLHKC